MLQLHVAALRPEMRALRRRVDDLLADANPACLTTLIVLSAALADCIADAPLTVRQVFIGMINDVLSMERPAAGH
jgi:hypothetical protein